jgi:uncharacterized RDD family membrane protein YckC
MATETASLDTAVEIITPENIAFRYRVAGPFRRLPAYLIDMVIRVLVWVGGSIVAGLAFGSIGLPQLGVAVLFLLWFLLEWLYGGVFEALWNGQTPGKRMMHLRVLTVEGLPIAGWQAVLRNILRAADMLPLTYQVGLLTMAANDRFQRLGDLATGTMVVVEEPHWFQGVVRLHEPEVVRMAAQIPVSFQASRTMARALAIYVQRRQHFPWMRRLEIARHLGEPLRQRFNLPAETNLDLLLCALYHRTFVSDRQDARESAPGESPFAPPQSNQATAEPVAPEPLAGHELDPSLPVSSESANPVP